MSNVECRISNGERTALAPRPSPRAPRAIDLAHALYAKHGGSLLRDLLEYRWPRGVIINLPDCFAIAYVTDTPAGELAWFIKTAVGDLAQLLTLFPVELPFIAFHREKSGDRLRFYRTARLRQLAQRSQRTQRISSSLLNQNNPLCPLCPPCEVPL